MAKFSEKIVQYARAGFPALYVTSWEEDRAMADIREAATRLGRRLFYWKLTGGIFEWKADGQHAVVCAEANGNPLNALKHVLAKKAGDEYSMPAARVVDGKVVGGSVIVFLDFHPYMADQNILRTLKDTLRYVKAEQRMLCFVSACAPRNGYPSEIEKEITVVDHNLPDETDLAGILDEVAKTNSVAVPVDARKDLIQAARGLTTWEAENAYAVSLVRSNNTAFSIKDVYSEKAQSVKKSGVLEVFEANSAFKDIGGVELVKAWARRRRNSNGEKARAYGLPAPHGLMLVGIQGCGKSLVAKAIAAEWNQPLIRFDIGRAYNSLQGKTEEAVRNAIATAEAVAPCVLWIDEVEKGMSGVKSSGTTDSGTAARVFGTLLTWLQEHTSPVFVVATSNDISALPPEFVRKPRFDEIFFVDLPTHAERVEITKIHLAKRNRDAQKFDVNLIADKTEGFSGAEIEAAIVDSMYTAFDDNEREVETQDVVAAAKVTVPLSRTSEEVISKLRSWASEGRARPASLPKDSVSTVDTPGKRRTSSN
jgi:ATP-dependent 26S proteasome regulatory subunit